MGRVFLVTGATGHLGTAVSEALLARGERVRIIATPGDPHVPVGILDVYVGDVRHRASLEPAFQVAPGTELVVVHCAGIVSIAGKPSPLVREVNVEGTRNVVALCELHEARLIHISSVHAIPELPHGQTITEVSHFDPALVIGGYAQTKAEASQLVLDAVARGLDACIVHPSGLVGPGDNGRGHITALVSDYCRGHLGAAIEGGYDFVDVRDVAAGIVAACDLGRPGESYILSNRFFTLRELLGMLSDVTGRRPVRTYLPIGFIKTVAPLAELYYKLRRQPPLFTAYSMYTLSSNGSFSHAKADKDLGYSTRDMRRTLMDTIDWLKEQGRI